MRVTQRVVDRGRDRVRLTGAGSRRKRLQALGLFDPLALIEIAAHRDVEDLIARRAELLGRVEAGSDRLRLQAEWDRDVARRPRLRDDAVLAGQVALDRHPVRPVVEQAARVEREVAVARVERRPVAVRLAQDEETVAVHGEVRVDAGRREAALREVRVDRTDLHAQTRVLGVDAAVHLGRRRGEALRLIDQVLEVDVLPLEAGRPNVGDVVRDGVDLVLVRFQTGDTDEQRIESHLTDLSCHRTMGRRSIGPTRELQLVRSLSENGKGCYGAPSGNVAVLVSRAPQRLGAPRSGGRGGWAGAPLSGHHSMIAAESMFVKTFSFMLVWSTAVMTVRFWIDTTIATSRIMKSDCFAPLAAALSAIAFIFATSSEERRMLRDSRRCCA